VFSQITALKYEQFLDQQKVVCKEKDCAPLILYFGGDYGKIAKNTFFRFVDFLFWELSHRILQ